MTPDRPRCRRLTPPGPGGVALVELAGAGSTRLLQGLLEPRRAFPRPGGLALGLLRDAKGEAVDEVLVARPGEDAYELGCHGGPAVVARVLEVLAAAGAERLDRAAPPAAPPAAAALALLPQATTELGCRVLLRQAAGALEEAVRAVRERVDRPAEALPLLDRLLATAPLGRALLDPPRVALVGLPNAGKSSLLNALLGHERALVAPEAGTTRDAIEATADLEGVPVALVDTAGRRETTCAVEAAGVARARGAAAGAAARLVVLDGAALLEPALGLAAEAAPPRVLVLNKRDLLDAAGLEAAAARLRAATGEPGVAVSAATGEGLAGLAAALRRALVGEPDPAGAVVFDARQEAALRAAREALAEAAVEAAVAALDGLLAGGDA